MLVVAEINGRIIPLPLIKKKLQNGLMIHPFITSYNYLNKNLKYQVKQKQNQGLFLWLVLGGGRS